MHTYEATVRRLLDEGELLLTSAAMLPVEADLRAAGLSSLRMVQLLLAIEEAYEIVVPDVALTQTRFSSIRSVAELVAEVVDGRE